MYQCGNLISDRASKYVLARHFISTSGVQVDTYRYMQEHIKKGVDNGVQITAPRYMSVTVACGGPNDVSKMSTIIRTYGYPKTDTSTREVPDPACACRVAK
jgi:hypothetical protein